MRQTDLAVLAEEMAVRTEQNGRIVHGHVLPFVQAQDDVELVLPGQLPEVLRGGPGHGFGDLVRLLSHADVRHGLAQHHEVSSLLRRVRDQRSVLLAIRTRRFAGRCVMHGGQTHLAARRRRTLGERGHAPGYAPPGAH